MQILRLIETDRRTCGLTNDAADAFASGWLPVEMLVVCGSVMKDFLGEGAGDTEAEPRPQDLNPRVP